MAQFIKVNDSVVDDCSYKVNVDHIVTYTSVGGGTRIALTNIDPIKVKETEDELDELIQNVKRDSVRSGV